MMVDPSTVLGSVAAICSTASFAPQAWKIIKTRATANISTGMYCLTVVGFALWAGYGVLLGQWSLVASNSVCLFLAGFILTMKLLPRAGKDALAASVDLSNDP